jgi:hypothetical protein
VEGSKVLKEGFRFRVSGFGTEGGVRFQCSGVRTDGGFSFQCSGLEKKVSGVSIQVSEQREVPSQSLVAGAALGIS